MTFVIHTGTLSFSPSIQQRNKGKIIPHPNNKETKAKETQSIEYFYSYNYFSSMLKLQQAFKSWSNFGLILFGKGREIHRSMPRFKWGKLAAPKSQSSPHFICSGQTSCLWPRSRLRLKVVDNARVRDECGSSNPFTNTLQCSSRRKHSRKIHFGFSGRTLPLTLLLEKCGSCGARVRRW